MKKNIRTSCFVYCTTSTTSTQYFTVLHYSVLHYSVLTVVSFDLNRVDLHGRREGHDQRLREEATRDPWLDGRPQKKAV